MQHDPEGTQRAFGALDCRDMAPEDIVQAVHAGQATFADLVTHFPDWKEAAKYYADRTNERFPPQIGTEQCDLCGLQGRLQQHQLLFRAFLDRQWGKKVIKGLALLPHLLLPVFMVNFNQRRGGLRLIFPTYHWLCGPCRSRLALRAAVATTVECVLSVLHILLFICGIFGLIGIASSIAVLSSHGFEGIQNRSRFLLINAACILPFPLMWLIRHARRRWTSWLRFPRSLRHLGPAPFEYVARHCSLIQEPVTWED